jgi:hypothetical protein
MSTKQTITSPLNSLNIKKKATAYMTFEIQVLAWDRLKNVVGLIQDLQWQYTVHMYINK